MKGLPCVILSMACMHGGDDEDESTQMENTSCSACMGCISPPNMIALGSEESLVLGDDVEVMALLFFNLFFIVEFQKFLISLSVLPGRRAAICDPLVIDMRVEN